MDFSLQFYFFFIFFHLCCAFLWKIRVIWHLWGMCPQKVQNYVIGWVIKIGNYQNEGNWHHAHFHCHENLCFGGQFPSWTLLAVPAIIWLLWLQNFAGSPCNHLTAVAAKFCWQSLQSFDCCGCKILLAVPAIIWLLWLQNLLAVPAIIWLLWLQNFAGSPCNHLTAVAAKFCWQSLQSFDCCGCKILLAASVRFCSNNFFFFCSCKIRGQFSSKKKNQQLGPVVMLNSTGMLQICLAIVLTSIGIPQICLAVVLNSTGTQSKRGRGPHCLCRINKQGS